MIKLFVSAILATLLFSCSSINDERKNLEYQVDSISEILYETQNNYRFSYTLQLDTFDPEMDVIDLNLDTCSLVEIMNDSDRLYFHYCDLYCNSCLDKQLLRLQEFESQYGEQALCIIGSVQSYRSIVNLVKNYKFQCDIFMVLNEESIFQHHPHFKNPYYFTVSNRFNIDLLHFPIIEDSTTTKLFFRLAQEKTKPQKSQANF